MLTCIQKFREGLVIALLNDGPKDQNLGKDIIYSDMREIC